jgi:hypothetical protein
VRTSTPVGVIRRVSSNWAEYFPSGEQEEEEEIGGGQGGFGGQGGINGDVGVWGGTGWRGGREATTGLVGKVHPGAAVRTSTPVGVIRRVSSNWAE